MFVFTRRRGSARTSGDLHVQSTAGGAKGISINRITILYSTMARTVLSLL
jgi:hypothetical protein